MHIFCNLSQLLHISFHTRVSNIKGKANLNHKCVNTFIPQMPYVARRLAPVETSRCPPPHANFCKLMFNLEMSAVCTSRGPTAFKTKPFAHRNWFVTQIVFVCVECLGGSQRVMVNVNSFIVGAFGGQHAPQPFMTFYDQLPRFRRFDVSALLNCPCPNHSIHGCVYKSRPKQIY